MNNSEIELSSNDILSKEFKIDTRGYRPQEVDKFLDTIIRDYDNFNRLLKIAANLSSVLSVCSFCVSTITPHLS